MVPATPQRDPRGTETGCHTAFSSEKRSGSIAMDELDLIGDTQFLSVRISQLLARDQRAHVDAGADDSVIAVPRCTASPRTAAEVEYSGPVFQTQRRAESGELSGVNGLSESPVKSNFR